MRAHESLEEKWAQFNHLDPAGMVCCSSGTAALHLALEALRLPPSAQVIVPDYTMIACARAVTLAGLEPVFVDCDERLLMDLTLPEMGPGVKNLNTYAMMAVHVYGRRVDMHKLHQAAEPRGLAVIEDLAEAHGILPHKHTDAACWSFYRNKIVAGEEGGAVWFRNHIHAAMARQLRNLGSTSANDYTHMARGHNYRMSNLHAAYIMCESVVWHNENSIHHYERNVQLRREVEAAYNVQCPPEWRMPYRDAPWVYDLRIPGLTRGRQDKIVAGLRAVGVEARHGFKPMRRQPEYLNVNWPAEPTKADIASREVIYLPLTGDMRYRADLVFTAIAAHV